MQELIEDIKANIAGCACNLNEAGLSEKERAHYNGAIIAGKDALRKATELLPKERQDIQEAFDKGKGNVFGKTCFLIKDGTEYFDKTFTQNK